jgi:hypothetical protein
MLAPELEWPLCAKESRGPSHRNWPQEPLANVTEIHWLVTTFNLRSFAMPILKHPNSGRTSPGAMTTHMWGAAVIVWPVDSATAGGCPPSRKSSAKPTLNVKTEFEDVMPHNLRGIAGFLEVRISLELRADGESSFTTIDEFVFVSVSRN